MSVEAYWKSLFVLEKMIRPISQSHSTDSSYAFFIKPSLRFEKVTYICTQTVRLPRVTAASNLASTVIVD